MGVWILTVICLNSCQLLVDVISQNYTNVIFLVCIRINFQFVYLVHNQFINYVPFPDNWNFRVKYNAHFPVSLLSYQLEFHSRDISWQNEIMDLFAKNCTFKWGPTPGSTSSLDHGDQEIALFIWFLFFLVVAWTRKQISLCSVTIFRAFDLVAAHFCSFF